jgi:hypothetical protein
MTVRLSFHQVMSRNRLCQIAAAAAIVFAVTAGAPGAQAATDDAASAPAEASAPLAAGSQYTIRPGQSLHDVAVAATQSHDRATLARASQALFEANPNAFMAHDPSRLRVGAVLTIPALDATGAAVPGAGASAASGASAGSAASVASASAPAQPATAASAASPLATAAQHGVPATVTAGSTPLQASAATASAAMAGVAVHLRALPLLRLLRPRRRPPQRVRRPYRKRAAQMCGRAPFNRRPARRTRGRQRCCRLRRLPRRRWCRRLQRFPVCSSCSP